MERKTDGDTQNDRKSHTETDRCRDRDRPREKEGW